MVGRKSAKARDLLAHPIRIEHGPIDFEMRHRHADRVRPRRTIGREDRESVARRPLANGDARLEDDTALVAGVARQNAIGITIGLGETVADDGVQAAHEKRAGRSEEHTSELQSLMRISYAVFCLKKKKNK